MKLSIIIPVYNGEKYIAKCLDSMCNKETVFDYEIIIIDDGSTDSTIDILENYATQYKNIKVIKNTNHGVSYSRNAGLKYAKGEYILFVDSDDFLCENWYKIIKKSMKNKIEDLVIFNLQYKCNHSNPNGIIKDILNTKKCNYYLSTPWSKLYKREIILNNNIQFDEDIINGEDMLFNINYIAHIKTFKIINENIYIYRVTPNSLTKNYNKKILKSDLKYITELKSVLSKVEIINSKEIIESEKYNGLYLILVRLSTNLLLSNAIEQIKNIDLNFYNFKYKVDDLNIFKKLILFLFKNKKYKLMLSILKTKNIFIKSKNSSEKMIKI